jgi:dihydropteroate synthase
MKYVTKCGSLSIEWGKRTYIMGILNVTPDSFSGDGVRNDVGLALEQALRFQNDGADIIDVGGESTRPGSIPIDLDEERRRVIPVVRSLVSKLSIPISVDTYKPRLAEEAIGAGAAMINDIWGLKHDISMASVVSHSNVPVILMHNQDGVEYSDLIPDVIDSLSKSIECAIDSGIREENIILDPGIGFGKTPSHNLQLIRRLGEIKDMGFPVLIGTSRKSTLGLVLDLPVDDRLEGTAATVAISIANGVDIVRVHDVREMKRVSLMSDAIVRDMIA